MRNTILAAVAATVIASVATYGGIRYFTSQSPCCGCSIEKSSQPESDDVGSPAPNSETLPAENPVANQQPTNNPMVIKVQQFAPDSAYGPPDDSGPPEHIQIERLNPVIVDAIYKSLDADKYKFRPELPPAPEVDDQPGVVVMNRFDAVPPAGGTAQGKSSTPVRRMPRCDEEEAPVPKMPYADDGDKTAADERSIPAIVQPSNGLFLLQRHADEKKRMPRTSDKDAETEPTSERKKTSSRKSNLHRALRPNFLPSLPKFQVPGTSSHEQWLKEQDRQSRYAFYFHIF